MCNSVVGIRYTKNVVRDERGNIIKESDPWHMGFATFEDYRKWLDKNKGKVRILEEERYVY